MTTTTDTLAFEWSISSSDGVPPEQLRTLAPRTEVNLPATDSADFTALELLRAAGLHFDQEALTPHPEHRQLTLYGTAAPEDLAVAIVEAVRNRSATLAVDAAATPLRLFEVATISSPMLVIASLASGAHQVPAERDAVGNALRRATAERGHQPVTTPLQTNANGTEATNGQQMTTNESSVNQPSGNGAASMSGGSLANAVTEAHSEAHRHSLSPDDVAPDVNTGVGERSDEMVNQEPDRQHDLIQHPGDRSRGARALGMVTAPVRSAGRVAKRTRVMPAVLPLSIAGAAIAGRKFGSPRRWIAVAAVTSILAAVADTLLIRRRHEHVPTEAEQDAQAQLDSERVAMERHSDLPTV
jgi:hypothetical protein